MYKKEIRDKAFKYLSRYGEDIETKFRNICGKTGQYNVPNELYQKRTKRSNRSLISWQTVKDNHLTFEQLNTFEGGVVVEIMNNDYFDEKNKNNELFIELCKKMGSDENVSSIITIRSEGDSSSQLQRESFEKLINNTHVYYKGTDVILTKDNYKSFAIKRNVAGKGIGNDVWDGFLYVSIRGGQQDTIETHKGLELTLFNPACEYANADVCLDIDLVCAYFALLSIDTNKIDESDKTIHDRLMTDVIECLKESEYDFANWKGDVYDYVKKHHSVSLYKGKLTDPIQLKDISIEAFSNSKRNGDSVDLTHNEAIKINKFYWDSKKKCILSPARPTNIFWSYHLSNMMQQDYNLDDYFKFEEERFKKRKMLLSKIDE